MSRKSIVTAALLTGLFLAPQAHAANYWLCGGSKVVWGNPFAMVQNTYSMVPGGARELTADQAILRWQNVIGMENMVSKSPTVNTGSSIAQFNFQNDLAVVPAGSLGPGRIGLTLAVHDGCFLGGRWLEADVMVESDLDFGQVEETALPGGSARLAFLHEFGHAHGLNHTQTFNVMRTGLPVPVVGGTGETVDVLPDDAKGGRLLYPTGNTEVNLFASAHLRNKADQIKLGNAAGTKTFCSKGGGSLTLNATVGNNGTVNVQQTERWWVSKSKTAHGGGIKVGQWSNGTFLANVVNTRKLEFTMPALEPGTYFLYHGVDVLDEVEESREDDNVVREGVTILIKDC